MKTLIANSAMLTVIVLGCVSNLAAQTTAPGTLVAVLDVAKVFKNHTRFTQKMEEMKKEVKAFEDDVNNQRRDLLERAKQLNETYRPGSPEYKRTEAELAQQESDLRLQMQLKRKEVLENEARLYYDTYQEIQGIVNQMAEQYQIGLVVRHDSEEVGRDDGTKVLGLVNRFVIYQKKLDLTNAVIERVQ